MGCKVVRQVKVISNRMIDVWLDVGRSDFFHNVDFARFLL